MFAGLFKNTSLHSILPIRDIRTRIGMVSQRFNLFSHMNVPMVVTHEMGFAQEVTDRVVMMDAGEPAHPGLHRRGHPASSRVPPGPAVHVGWSRTSPPQARVAWAVPAVGVEFAPCQPGSGEATRAPATW